MNRVAHLPGVFPAAVRVALFDTAILDENAFVAASLGLICPDLIRPDLNLLTRVFVNKIGLAIFFDLFEPVGIEAHVAM